MLVVPIKVHAKVFLAIPILIAFVGHIENLEQVLSVLLASVFHPEIVDAEREGDGS